MADDKERFANEFGMGEADVPYGLQGDRIMSQSDWMYLHAVCHPAAGTWLRLGLNDAHVLECRECRKIVTAFRVIEAVNINHEPGLSYEEAIEPFLDPFTCYRCNIVSDMTDEREAVEAGWLARDWQWACPSCRLEEIAEVLPHLGVEPKGGICGEKNFRDGVLICRQSAGHEGGCDYEPI